MFLSELALLTEIDLAGYVLFPACFVSDLIIIIIIIIVIMFVLARRSRRLLCSAPDTPRHTHTYPCILCVPLTYPCTPDIPLYP